MEFFNETGRAALGSRLRLLTAKITDDASKIYDLYQIKFVPKWFPVYFTLDNKGPMTVSAIARAISHSQPSVTKIVKEMSAAGLVKDNLENKDKRHNLVALTDQGRGLSETIRSQLTDIEQAMEDIMNQADHNLWEAIAEWEYLLEQKSLFQRVLERKKIRESKEVTIVSYGSEYRQAFRDLNKQWIETYFEMEEKDLQVLNNPEEYIIKHGGEILVALLEGKAVGVCALVKAEVPDYEYEMAKMAVDPVAQGRNIGWLLGQALIQRAKVLGARKLFLESNTILKPAIGLYQKLGFKKIAGYKSPYKRANIQMGLDLLTL